MRFLRQKIIHSLLHIGQYIYIHTHYTLFMNVARSEVSVEEDA